MKNDDDGYLIFVFFYQVTFITRHGKPLLQLFTLSKHLQFLVRFALQERFEK